VQIAVVGLGRMGAGITRRLLEGGHACVVYDVQPAAVQPFEAAGAVGAADLDQLVAQLEPPRVVWVMVPAAFVGSVVDQLAERLSPGDVVIDGGNTFYRDDLVRSRALGERGIHFVDVGTSGGVFGRERGYCLMIGGETDVVRRLDPIFATLAPGMAAASRAPSREGSTPTTAEQGYLHCGPAGAGHFVKMVHNGVEYGLMAAYAEGLAILDGAGVGDRAGWTQDAETAPLRDPDAYRYAFDLPEIAELWRRGSVVGSWLLDLTADALHREPGLGSLGTSVADSGEGRWTVQAAVDVGVPAPVMAAALWDRFASRGEGDFAHRVLSAMRREFGGHLEGA
jgi:6-phosphogluconate dehydrogenase